MQLGGIADSLVQSGLWDWHEYLVCPELKDGTEHVEHDNMSILLEGHIEKCNCGQNYTHFEILKIHVYLILCSN